MNRFYNNYVIQSLIFFLYIYLPGTKLAKFYIKAMEYLIVANVIYNNVVSYSQRAA